MNDANAATIAPETLEPKRPKGDWREVGSTLLGDEGRPVLGFQLGPICALSSVDGPEEKALYHVSITLLLRDGTRGRISDANAKTVLAAFDMTGAFEKKAGRMDKMLRHYFVPVRP